MRFMILTFVILLSVVSSWAGDQSTGSSSVSASDDPRSSAPKNSFTFDLAELIFGYTAADTKQTALSFRYQRRASERFGTASGLSVFMPSRGGIAVDPFVGVHIHENIWKRSELFLAVDGGWRFTAIPWLNSGAFAVISMGLELTPGIFEDRNSKIHSREKVSVWLTKNPKNFVIQTGIKARFDQYEPGFDPALFLNIGIGYGGIK